MPEITQLKLCQGPVPPVTGWKTLEDAISRKLCLLESDSLLAAAKRRTRLKDFGPPAIDPALSILVKSLECEANLHPLGKILMRVHLRQLLEARLQLTQAWKWMLADLNASVIERPIFITGMPRSGSTFLHELLAEDPENRA